jgi:AmmeMemoRadiSam system protein B
MDEKPRLRTDLEFFPIQQGKERFVFIKDSLGLADGRLIPFSLFEILIQMDGNNSLRDIQVFIMRKSGGMIVKKEDVEGLIKKLDEMFLLDSERYRSERQKIETEFLYKKVRDCFHCGKSYPKDPLELKDMIEKIVKEPATNSNSNEVIGLIAPHIDISVGAKVYGSVYREIKGRSYSKVIIIGVGHNLSDNFFSVTEKDFETPLGIAKTYKEGVRSLKRAAPDVIADKDFVHKTEHSIEFQLIFLQHLLRGDFEILPILCGPVKLLLNGEYSRSSYLKKVRPFVETLANIFSEGKNLLVAGVDLSHIGPKFGHEMPASYIEPQARKHDYALIDAILKKSPDSFWEESKKVNDKYNVCGFSALSCFLELIIRYSLGKVLDSNACVMELLPTDIKAELLDYEIWHEKSTNSAVSFCGIKFLA